ncbi:MAG: rubrerythrin [Desulfobacteraceae bacterium]|nr:MAG: rubrerythrin [Desulfobacteraceae bacterium]
MKVLMSQPIVDILKEAILLERRGRALYQKAADHSENTAVRDFFQMLADEEDHHSRVLEKHFKTFSDHRRLADMEAQTAGHKTSLDGALRYVIKPHIAAAGFEAAAISAALLIEEQSVTLYSDQARQTTEPKEKALFRWLAEWEHGHLTFLVGLERDIREQVWNDPHFWSF